MKLFELLKEKSGKFEDTVISGIVCDSRSVNKGSAFVCIDGVNADGHNFAETANEKGASVIIVQRDLGLTNQIIVDDTRRVYAEMCAEWFGNPAKDLKIIGVTGTNGKTSVSYMLKAIIEKNGFKCGLVGTIQNMIGNEVLPAKNTTPSAYELNSMFSLMKSAGCEYCIMEVSSHALDQKRVYGIEFEAAMFTNLTQDHLDYHKTMDNYLMAKRKLFESCKIAIVNFDDKYYKRLTEDLNCEIKTYSAESDESTYTAKNIVYKPDGVDFEFVGFGLISRVKMLTGGKFTVYNAMCAASCAIELGFSISSTVSALGELNGVKGRAEVVPNDKDFTIIIDYAHTPDGLENILNTFKVCEKNRLIVVFGCGGDRDRTKRPKMGAIAAQLADFCIVTSDNPRSEEPDDIIKDILQGMKDYKTPYKVITNRVEAINFAVANARSSDIIVLAGKGHETYQVLKNGTIHLDEREVVAAALSNLK